MIQSDVSFPEDVQTYLDKIEAKPTRQQTVELVLLLRDVTGAVPIMWNEDMIGFGEFYRIFGKPPPEWVIETIFGLRVHKALFEIYHWPSFYAYKALRAPLDQHRVSYRSFYISIRRFPAFNKTTLRTFLTHIVNDVRATSPTYQQMLGRYRGGNFDTPSAERILHNTIQQTLWYITDYVYSDTGQELRLPRLLLMRKNRVWRDADVQEFLYLEQVLMPHLGVILALLQAHPHIEAPSFLVNTLQLDTLRTVALDIFDSADDQWMKADVRLQRRVTIVQTFDDLMTRFAAS